MEHLLTEALRQRGVAADYVASYRPDGSTSSSDGEILESFRQPNGGLEALVNVQMLTEGVDVPGIQTIFLARPTMSEILLRQMIGRGLRGPKCGGTERAYIVSFEDHWNQFRDYLSPFELVRDITPPPPDQNPERERAERILGTIPWDLIRGVAAQIRTRGMAFQADAFEAVPHGWFLFEQVVDGEQVQHIVSVFEHELPCWTEVLNHLSELNSTSLAQLVAAEEYEEYFSDCDDPRPPSHEIRQAIEHFRSGGGRPEYFEYTERKACDPRLIAAEIYDKDLGERSRTALIEQRYSMLAAAIYPSLFEFRVAVDDALQELSFPDASTRIVRGVPIFTPRPAQQLRPGSYHALDRLIIEVLERGRDLLQAHATLPMPSRLEWSKHIIKGWHGKAYWQDDGCPPPGRICINKLLDSPDVSEATLRFLLWHEYLHLYLKGLHTPTFRRFERLWPDCPQCERELDNLGERFEIAYW